MSWAMLRTARIAHLLGCAESSGVGVVIGTVPSLAAMVEVEKSSPSGDNHSTYFSEPSMRNGGLATV
jgi:hypothetical protein